MDEPPRALACNGEADALLRRESPYRDGHFWWANAHQNSLLNQSILRCIRIGPDANTRLFGSLSSFRVILLDQLSHMLAPHLINRCAGVKAILSHMFNVQFERRINEYASVAVGRKVAH